MSDTRDARAVIESAEHAAASGDYASAARLLHEATVLQEASLGAFHPDLANTLNNLGVAYEILDRPDEAETCYRRAHSIARASLRPDDPLVETSGKNLRDFCEARGRPLAVPAAALPPPAEVPFPPPAASLAERADIIREAPAFEATPPPPRRHRWVVVAACAVAIAVVAIIAARMWVGVRAGAGFAPDEPVVTTTPAAPAPTGEPASAPTPPPAAPAAAANESSPPPAANPATTGAVAASSLSVVEARVCRTLPITGSRAWQCDPVSSPIEPGRLFFYTRVKSPTNTTIQHLWYQGARLYQTVDLPVRANPGAGYRTYSRQSIYGPSAGDWRVELRAQDGTVLAEAKVTVR